MPTCSATSSAISSGTIPEVPSGVLSLRHFGLVLFIPWRVGAEESGAAKDGFGGSMLLDRLGPPGRGRGCRPHDGEVAGGAVADLGLLISGPRFNINSHIRAREGADGQAVVCRLLRGRSPPRGDRQSVV